MYTKDGEKAYRENSGNTPEKIEDWLDKLYPNREKKPPRDNKICCPSCGEWTVLSNPFMMVIPKGGLKCQKCGAVVIHDSGVTW